VKNCNRKPSSEQEHCVLQRNLVTPSEASGEEVLEVRAWESTEDEQNFTRCQGRIIAVSLNTSDEIEIHEQLLVIIRVSIS